jgi:hypothetical protein
MSGWPSFPFIYEINTWVWLGELSQTQGRAVTLDCVADEVWDGMEALGFDAVWLMGVWERSPAGLGIANQNTSLCAQFQRALPDFKPADNVGSPYCVRNYSVAARLGGRKGLEGARAALARRGMRLILDYVPNHVAPDHLWAIEHPEYFIQGTLTDLGQQPGSYVNIGQHVFACGKDPYFPAWPDVLQLNAFSPALRAAAAATVRDIASQCDAVRCDMAMLMLNDVFERTWAARAGPKPGSDYWPDLIANVQRAHPEFRFLAEAYWDLEWDLQNQGFSFCYDKRLYDRLEHEAAESVRLHLCAAWDYQRRLVRFLENHDEPRAATVFALPKEHAAAVVTLTSPGARLLHEGQLDGRKVRVPVFLGRRPAEPGNGALRSFYTRLLTATGAEAFREGHWQLCERCGWPDNTSHLNIVAGCWDHRDQRYVIVTNLSESRSQARVRLPWNELTGHTWHLTDRLSGQTFERDGNELYGPGLYVDLPGWDSHFLAVG